jgi:oligogalacturonide lyase
MASQWARRASWTRRTFLATAAIPVGIRGLLSAQTPRQRTAQSTKPLPGAGAAASQVIPSAAIRYLDPSTEFEVYRLTDPAFTCGLPAHHARCISTRRRFLLYWSDRTGSVQAYQLNLQDGTSRVLSGGSQVDGSSLRLLPGDTSFCYWNGPALMLAVLGTAVREREVYRAGAGVERVPGAFSITPDGRNAVFAESSGGDASSIRMVDLRTRAVRRLTTLTARVKDMQVRPRDQMALLVEVEGQGLMVLRPGATQATPLPTEGPTVSPLWSPDGRGVLYLHAPGESGTKSVLRFRDLQESTDQLVGPTSQFGSVEANADASVFVGASRSKAAPYVMLLLRVTRRELVLCEHGASEVGLVAPMFAPDSRSIFFHSDRDGELAIYRIHVDRLVEPTET